LRKPNGNVRLVVDFVELNKNVSNVPAAYPSIDSLTSATLGYTCFSSLDLQQGFFNVACDPESRELLGVVYDGQLYRFERLPQGVKCAPGHFHLALTRLFHRCILEGILSQYFDDLLIKTRTATEHLAAVRRVFEICRSANLRLNLAKCKWFQREVSYLGQLVNGTTRVTDPARLQPFSDMGMPRTVPELRSWLGMAQFYTTFVKGLSGLLKPFHELLNNSTRLPTRWPAALATQFIAVKEAILTQSPLLCPNWHKPFVLRTDASKDAAGGVLMQLNASGQLQPCAYFSHRFTAAEMKYNTSEREALAMVLAINRFKQWLQFARFTVQTDHANLQWMVASTNDRVRRWASTLSTYDFSLEFLPGKLNTVADALSRVGLPAPAPESVAAMAASVSFSLTAAPSLKSVSATLAVLSAALPVAPLTSLTMAAGMAPSTPSLELDLLRRVAAAQQAAPAAEQAAWASNELFHRERRSGVNVWCLQANLWLPSAATDVKRELLTFAHDTSGHGGVRRTLKRFHDACIAWSGMHRDIETFVRSCTSCQRAKAPVAMPRQAHLHPITASHPFDLVVADYFGPMPTAEGGPPTYILTIVDKFTRFIRFYPVKGQPSADTTIATLQLFFFEFEVPKRLRTDRGSHFDNKRVRAYLQKCNVSYEPSPALHVQGQGVAERIHRELLQTLRATNADRVQLWQAVLPAIAHQLNTAENSAIGMSPYQALFGRVSRTLMLSQIGTPLPVFRDPLALHKALEATREYVSHKQEHAFGLSKALHDCTVTPRSFKEGDIVMAYFEDTSSKFTNDWRAPCRVLRRVHENRYLVHDISSDYKFEAHTNRLLPFDVSRTSVSDALEQNLPDGYYIIEAVLEHRGAGTTLEFLLKYKDVPEPKWTAASHADLAKIQRVKDYRIANGLNVAKPKPPMPTTKQPAAARARTPAPSPKPIVVPAAPQRTQSAGPRARARLQPERLTYRK